MFKKVILIVMALIVSSIPASAVEVYKDGDASLSVGFWGQTWVQTVSDYDTDDDTVWDESLTDFMVRRAYFNIKGEVNPSISMFVHYAADRLGQEGLDSPGKGLGSGLALRDGWVNYKVADNDFMIQIGRMYIPFTRNYGTTSTKNLLTTELNWGQGGIRSGIFYPSNIGRDDSITLWGSVIDDKLQYRLMIGEGVESKTTNPDDNLRYAGRLSYNVFDTETGWFNSGTYLGKKNILAIGIGADTQESLMLGGTEKEDYQGMTADVHYDRPLGCGVLTVQASYIDIENAVNGVTWTNLSAGDDGSIISLMAGYFCECKIGPGQLQPFLHYSLIDSDENDALTGMEEDSTTVYGLGLNYYLKGAANKLTAEVTMIDQEEEIENTAMQNHTIVTLQAAFGF